MKKLAIGYVLSAFNCLSLTPLAIYLLFPTMLTYPFSIVLRGLGWREVRRRTGIGSASFVVIFLLGFATFLVVLLTFIETMPREALQIAALTWTLYSVAELYLYNSAARNLGVKTFHAASVNILGVASIDYVAFTVLPGSLQSFPEEIGGFLYLGAGVLIVSALAAAIASGKISATHYRTLETFPQLPPPVKTSSIQRPAQPLIKLEPLREGSQKTCPKCRTANPLTAKICSECGAVLAGETGLRCPVCDAPFSYAKKLRKDRYLCGLCGSTLLIKQG
ncbi:MAG: zinc ribbon domain-containing protein [Candidatus Caldarchaeum sp.]